MSITYYIIKHFSLDGYCYQKINKWNEGKPLSLEKKN